MIRPDTFGDIKVYPCLVGLSDLVNDLEDKHQEYISSFLAHFNEICKKASKIEDEDFQHYVLTLVGDTYDQRLESFEEKFGKSVYSHTRNYVTTKLKIMKQTLKPVRLSMTELKRVTCGIFLIDATGKFLVAHPTNAADNIWSIPKGLRDAGEDVYDAAKREFFEETGIDIDKYDAKFAFKIQDVRYNDKKKALCAFFYTTDQIIDPNKCVCASLVYPKDGRQPFPENDKFAMFGPDDLDKIHYTQKSAYNIYLYSEKINFDERQ